MRARAPGRLLRLQVERIDPLRFLVGCRKKATKSGSGCLLLSLIRFLFQPSPEGIQNATARIVHQASFQTSATALRQQLHWLPIRQRITYKLATLTFKAKYCRTPLYLHEQLRDHQVARALRSTTAPLFYRPFVSTVFASRAFYYTLRLKFGTVSGHPQDRRTLSVVLGVA